LEPDFGERDTLFWWLEACCGFDGLADQGPGKSLAWFHGESNQVME